MMPATYKQFMKKDVQVEKINEAKPLTTGETKRKVLENAGASIQIMPQFHQSELKQEALEVQSDKTDSSWQIPLKPKNLTILF